jgi:hypothetical protein
VEKVEEYIPPGEDVNPTLRKFDEMLSYGPPPSRKIWMSRIDGRKYKFMEVNRIKNLARLRGSIPDLQKTLDTVKFLDSKKVLSRSGGG